jgi:hypothetical protein
MNIFVECADVAGFQCDVLVLKFAQAFFGADKLIADRLGNAAKDVALLPGAHLLLPSKGKVPARNILFLGVVDLYEFQYAQIREFSKRSMQLLTQEVPHATHVAMTMHGVNYGLDEGESFLAQLAGLIEAFHEGTVSPALQRITIVEQNQNRALRLRRILDKNLPPPFRVGHVEDVFFSSRINAGLKSDVKPHVFVAMPFAEEMEDVFHYGIQGAVNAAGLLCERADLSSFTGDVMEWVKKRITSSELVIADLSSANPNVYLEVGFAWGCGRPTVLLCRDASELKFDVKGQRCLVYKKIKDLEDALKKELEGLRNRSI